mmetsp:Transcript_13153/g.22268  ORF Transcript_13153/g.22268 Transcript_13153/m.22268 type:complete len:102 (+) Transcript_13153:1439-1744(+)
MEDRMYRHSSEAETLRTQNERLVRESNDMRRQLDLLMQKEDKTMSQYEKIIDQLKAEVLEKERESHAIEAREAIAKSELNLKNKELKNKISEMSHRSQSNL